MTRHFSAKVDDNQSDLVKTLRKLGATVQSLSRIGEGCPDLLIGYCGITDVAEVKDPAKVPSKQRLTEAQVLWIQVWHGADVRILKTDADCLLLLADMKTRGALLINQMESV